MFDLIIAALLLLAGGLTLCSLPWSDEDIEATDQAAREVLARIRARLGF